MMKNTSEVLLNQLDSIIETYKENRKRAKYEDLSDLDDIEIYKLLTRSRAAVEQISGGNSVYTRQIDEVAKKTNWSASNKIHAYIGAVEALREDLQSGYLLTIQERIHAEMFVDFLEMARFLLEDGYKDAAAVIAGSSLEAHLRHLCEKNGIDTEYTNPKGVVIPKNADRLNSDLKKEGVYFKIDQKNITAWQGLRNDAAHGKYDNYVTQQVSLMITGIRDFITRIPA